MSKDFFASKADPFREDLGAAPAAHGAAPTPNLDPEADFARGFKDASEDRSDPFSNIFGDLLSKLLPPLPGAEESRFDPEATARRLGGGFSPLDAAGAPPKDGSATVLVLNGNRLSTLLQAAAGLLDTEPTFSENVHTARELIDLVIDEITPDKPDTVVEPSKDLL